MFQALKTDQKIEVVLPVTCNSQVKTLLSFKFLLKKKVSIYFLKRLQEILSLNMLFNLKLLAKHEFCLKSVSAEKRVILDASSYPLGV